MSGQRYQISHILAELLHEHEPTEQPLLNGSDTETSSAVFAASSYGQKALQVMRRQSNRSLPRFRVCSAATQDRDDAFIVSKILGGKHNFQSALGRCSFTGQNGRNR